jgi:hypothetical protein
LQKCQEILNFGFSDLFRNGKVCGLGPCIVDHGLGPLHGAPAWRSGRETTGEWLGRCSGLPVLTGGGWGGEGQCGGLTMGLTGARGAAELPGDSGEVAAVVGLDGVVFRCGKGGERGGDWCGMLQGRGALL